MDKYKLTRIIAFIAISFLVVGLLFFGIKKWQAGNNIVKETPKETAGVSSPGNGTVTNAGNLKTAPAISDFGQAQNITSENYRIEQIRFGGDTALVVDESEKLPIEIYDVKNEPFSNRAGDESKMVITWKSNKLTFSEIAYSKSDGQNPKTAQENGFGFTHGIVLDNLDPGTGYLFQLKSKDRWGNARTSEYFGVYTGSKAVSVFELIGKTFNEIFGWAVKSR